MSLAWLLIIVLDRVAARQQILIPGGTVMGMRRVVSLAWCW